MASRPLTSNYVRVASSDADTADDDTHELSLADVSPPSKNAHRWSHIKDLDTFFSSIYHFWLSKGLTCIILEEVLGLLQFLFVIFLAILLLVGIDYQRLMVTGPAHNASVRIHSIIEQIKVDLLGRNSTILAPNSTVNIRVDDYREIKVGSVISFKSFLDGKVNWIWYFILAFALLFWLHRACRMVYRVRQMWDTQAFFRDVLGVNTSELDNYTWQEIQHRVIEAQKRHHMCVQKAKLTELDLCNRIMRQKNFMLALINQNIIQTRFTVPCWGERTFFTEELKFFYEMILFWGPRTPFHNTTLASGFRKGDKAELTHNLQYNITWYALISFLLSPIICIWHIFYSTFTAVELMERKKGALGMRRWSPLARQQLRNYNELDHNFQFRLNAAYTPAEKYVKAFMSPVLAILARHVAFVFAALLFVALAFAMVDETLIISNNVPLTIAGLGLVLTVCRSLIPDEDEASCPKQLLELVVKLTYYGPVPDWKGHEHTTRVREAFAMQFQYRLIFWIEQMLSPLLTPFILYFCLRPRAHDIVAFFHNFTVTVDGVGDICSFAQLDVRKHSNPMVSGEKTSEAPQVDQAEDTKTEMSILAFSIHNPHWQPPQQSRQFLDELRESAGEEALHTSMAGAPSPPVDPEAALLPSVAAWTTYPNPSSILQTSQAALAYQSLSVVGGQPVGEAGLNTPLLGGDSRTGSNQSSTLQGGEGISRQFSATSIYPSLAGEVNNTRRTLSHRQQLESIGNAALYWQQAHRRRRDYGMRPPYHGQSNV